MCSQLVVLSWFLCVFHPWFSQSIPHGWHRQVPAENTQLIISTNNFGQAKCSLGPDLWLPWDCMSEDVKMGKKKQPKGKIWKRAGKDSQHFLGILGCENAWHKVPRASLCC